MRYFPIIKKPWELIYVDGMAWMFAYVESSPYPSMGSITYPLLRYYDANGNLGVRNCDNYTYTEARKIAECMFRSMSCGNKTRITKHFVHTSGNMFVGYDPTIQLYIVCNKEEVHSAVNRVEEYYRVLEQTKETYGHDLAI